MRSYRALFRTPEFTPLFMASGTQIAAQTVAGLALATLVYRATGSPLLSAVSMFGPSLAQVVGATFLLSAADRLPPRAALTALSLSFAAFAAGTAVLTAPGLPLWPVFALIFLQGLIASVGGGVRWGLLNEILPKDGYLLGRSVLNMTSGLAQIVGFATGGALLTVLSPRTALILAALLHIASALLTGAGLTRRPPRALGRPSPSVTWRTNALLFSSRPRRLVLLALWIPNGLVVGCESLFVPYDPTAAGTLFACAALGMVVGDVTVGRLVPPPPGPPRGPVPPLRPPPAPAPGGGPHHPRLGGVRGEPGPAGTADVPDPGHPRGSRPRPALGGDADHAGGRGCGGGSGGADDLTGGGDRGDGRGVAGGDGGVGGVGAGRRWWPGSGPEGADAGRRRPGRPGEGQLSLPAR